jgi:hypothetical protein
MTKAEIQTEINQLVALPKLERWQRQRLAVLRTTESANCDEIRVEREAHNRKMNEFFSAAVKDFIAADALNCPPHQQARNLNALLRLAPK